jgi:hypothetical protein
MFGDAAVLLFILGCVGVAPGSRAPGLSVLHGHPTRAHNAHCNAPLHSLRVNLTHRPVPIVARTRAIIDFLWNNKNKAKQNCDQMRVLLLY